MKTLKGMANIFGVIIAAAATMAVAECAQSHTYGIVHVNGTLFCSCNGNETSNTPPPSSSSSPPFHNAKVRVQCTADVIANERAPSDVTKSNGAYLVVLVPRPNAAVSSILSACKIFVLTPLASCHPSLPQAGLVSSLKYVETVPFGSLYITYLAASGFTLRV
ncbi:uncharacterized protein LOC127244151 [Andrographis paniculata]|uniref:uncharacterized protein LOC127244151 n=1 Tax=Andrographis paniculata TaxID=175694 RepID=UPI0021E89FFD|nr:uncharacterized protein LOC127244151 [Andrographis paniculata]